MIIMELLKSEIAYLIGLLKNKMDNHTNQIFILFGQIFY